LNKKNSKKNNLIKIPKKSKKYKFYKGASWLLEDGSIYLVKGFHEEWTKEYEIYLGGKYTALELILLKNWISIVVYNNKYIEFCIADRFNDKIVTNLFNYISINQKEWEKILIMCLKDNYFIEIKNKPEIFDKNYFFSLVQKNT